MHYTHGNKPTVYSTSLRTIKNGHHLYFVVLTDALFLIIRVEADNQPPSDFKISDLCNVIIFGINYENLGRD